MISTPSPALSARAVSPSGLSRYMQAFSGWYAMPEPAASLGVRYYSTSAFSKVLASDDSGSAVVQGPSNVSGIRLGLAQRTVSAIWWVDIPNMGTTFGKAGSALSGQGLSLDYRLNRFVGVRGAAIAAEASATANVTVGGVTKSVTQRRPVVASFSGAAGPPSPGAPLGVPGLVLCPMSADANLSFDSAAIVPNGDLIGTAQMLPSGAPYPALWRSSKPSQVTALPPNALELGSRWNATLVEGKAEVANARGWVAGTQTLSKASASSPLPLQTVVHPVLWLPPSPTRAEWTTLDLVPQIQRRENGEVVSVNMPLSNASVKFMNDCGEILGTYTRADLAPSTYQRFFLWKLGRFYDLQNLVCNNTGYWITELRGLTNAGEILVLAKLYSDASATTKNFILRPLTDTDRDLYLSDAETDRALGSAGDYLAQLTALPVGAALASLWTGSQEDPSWPAFASGDARYRPPSFALKPASSDLLLSKDSANTSLGGNSSDDLPVITALMEIAETSNAGPGVEIEVTNRMNTSVADGDSAHALEVVDRIRVASVEVSERKESKLSPTADGGEFSASVSETEIDYCASGMLDASGTHEFVHRFKSEASPRVIFPIEEWETSELVQQTRVSGAPIFDYFVPWIDPINSEDDYSPGLGASTRTGTGYFGPENPDNPPMKVFYSSVGEEITELTGGGRYRNYIVIKRDVGAEITPDAVLDEMKGFQDTFVPVASENIGKVSAVFAFPATDYPNGPIDPAFTRKVVSTYGAHRRPDTASLRKLKYRFTRGGDSLPSDIVVWKESFTADPRPNAFQSLNQAENEVAANTSVWMWAKLPPGATTPTYLIDPSRAPFSHVSEDPPPKRQCGETGVGGAAVLGGALEIAAPGKPPLPRGKKTSPGLTVGIAAGYSGTVATLTTRAINLDPFYRGTYRIAMKAPAGVVVVGDPLTGIAALDERRFSVTASASNPLPQQALFSLYYTLHYPEAGIDFEDILIDTVRLNIVPAHWMPPIDPPIPPIPPVTEITAPSASGDLAIVAANGTTVREGDEEEPGLIVPFSPVPAGGGPSASPPALPTLKITGQVSTGTSQDPGRFKVVASGGVLGLVDSSPFSASSPETTRALQLTGPLPTGVSVTTFELKWVSATGEEHSGLDTVKVTLVPVEIGVDNNRDGTLALGSEADQTTEQKPYRFWLNNDDDTGWADDTYFAHRDNPWTPTEVDSRDDKIKQVRDLEDFARIHMKVEGLHSQLAAGTMTLGLKWKTVQSGTPKIRLFKAVEADGGTKYLSDTAKAADQVSASTGAIGVVEGTIALDLPVSFWTSTAFNSTKFLLFEAIEEGKGELAMVFKQGSAVIGEGGSVFLDLVDIRKMYEQWGINPAAVIPDPDRDVLLPISGVTAVPYLTAGQAFQPAWDENLQDKNYVICVHGWRKGGPAAATAAQFYKGRADEITMFKRLWHRGFKGRYIGFIWPTYDVEVVDPDGSYNGPASAYQSKFDHSEYRAWKCGEAFKNMVAGLPAGYKKKVFAHSLGNVVVGSALEKGMTVDNYALLNAAIPARCYNQAAPTDLRLVALAPPDPKFDLSDDPTATVRALSYRGDAASLGGARLEAVGGKISNFYLPNDSALSLLGGGWALFQTTLKPNPLESYEYENLPGFHEVQWDPVGPVNRVITDPHEAMAMVDASWSKAVGSISVPAGAGGTGIDTNINMDDPGMNFDKEHEAVFKWGCAKTWVFYSKLWDELNLPGTKAP